MNFARGEEHRQQAEVKVIVRHLVRQARPVGIQLAQPFQVPRGDAARRLRIETGEGVESAIVFGGELLEVVAAAAQLAGAEDL